jgi:anthranilate/para-aminobenzoate synthase component I
VSTRVLPSVVHQILDLPVAPLAGVIGAWPRSALLESGPGFSRAGRWSILAAYPRLVWEATASRWSLHTDSGVAETGEGDVLTVLDGLVRRFGLADPADHPDPRLPPFQVGGGIVADSDPEAEYEETLAKGRGMLAALTHGAGERDLP